MLYGLFSLRSALLRGTLLCLAIAGCGSSDSLTPQQQDIAQLKQAIQPLQDLEAAQHAGYSVIVADPGDGHTCLSDPTQGAMGVHYLKAALVDDTAIVTEPEALIYEPQQDGSVKFVGVEYVIPYSIHGENEAPPTLFGQPFMKNATFQLWGLHVWVGRHNPSGEFAMWNPDVTCEFAQAQAQASR
ncbi:MAG TPA: hypothetical protein VN607_10660 [Gemmatimonadaceae bacterium]|nr:hypothetical protein [Gemmatimonadaceae bacterium]